MEQEDMRNSIAYKLFPAGQPLRSHKETENRSLILAPNPNCSVTLLQSPEIAPRLPPPYPCLSFPQFLEKSDCLPSSAAHISSFLDHQLPDYSYYRGFNSLQVLRVPDKNLVIAIFPSGENSDRVGFSLLCTDDGILQILPQTAGLFSVAKDGNMNRQRITRLSVNPVSECDGVPCTVGILMVCTEYFICWYRVTIAARNDQGTFSACMGYLGCADLKALKGKAVKSSCWSPHFAEECLVLLDNGDLVTFSVDLSSSENRVIKKKMHISLAEKINSDKVDYLKQRLWVGCEYSWHPRLFVVCHYREVLLVDCMWERGCEVSSLQKLDSVSTGKNDEFLAMARAGGDGYSFAVTTRNFLLVLHVEQPEKPVVQWEHKLEFPLYISVFRLSELRLNETNSTSEEMGHGIILGSFWDNSFSFFCYGQDLYEKGTLLADLTSFYNSYSAWGLPCHLTMSESQCECRSCIFKRTFSGESDPIWIDSRQRKNLVLGFHVLDAELAGKLSSPDGSGGFILIRLTSSGILDAQPYNAISESKKVSETGHKRKSICLDENHLYDVRQSEYDGPKKFQHLRLEYLKAYIKGILGEIMDEKRPQLMEGSRLKNGTCHEMDAPGITQAGSSAAFSDVLKDITLPVSINEVALKSAYADLPTDLLQEAFSTYWDLKEDHDYLNEPLQFMGIPEQPRAPPFTFREPAARSNKWSSKVKPTDTLMSPILPPQFLLTLNQLCKEEIKQERNLKVAEYDSLFKHLCDKVMGVLKEHASSTSKAKDDGIVSLADDDTINVNADQKAKFCFHKPFALVEDPSSMVSPKPWHGYHTHSTFVFRTRAEFVSDITTDFAGNELFDMGSPIELNFSGPAVDLGLKEMEALRDLKKLDLDFQRSFKPYQDYIISSPELK